MTLDELQNAAAVYIEAWTVHTVDLDASWDRDYRDYIKEWLQNGHYTDDVTYSCEGLLAEFCDYHGIEDRHAEMLKVPCPNCGGKGGFAVMSEISGPHYHDCDVCEGRGKVLAQMQAEAQR